MLLALFLLQLPEGEVVLSWFVTERRTIALGEALTASKYKCFAELTGYNRP